MYRAEQFTELEKLQNEMTSRGWLLPKLMKDLLIEWFFDKRAKNSSEHSENIFEKITELCTLYKHREPIVQLELSLWKMACFISPSDTMMLDPVNYFFRGGWKKTKVASRHDPLIGIVITNVLPFLTSDDYKIASLRADYPWKTISSLIVSNAGSEDVNGIYTNHRGKMHNGAPVFTKPGTYEGDDVTYRIYNRLLDPYDYVWYISISSSDRPNGGIDFYRLQFVAGDSEDFEQIPPTKGWETLDDEDGGIYPGSMEGGIHPPPLIIPVKGVA